MSQTTSFKWVTGTESNIVKLNNNTYQIKLEKDGSRYVVDLLENNFSIDKVTTNNAKFQELVDSYLTVPEQILQWGNSILKNEIKKCEHCKETRYTKKLPPYDKEEQPFKDYDCVCPTCHMNLCNKMFSENQKAREEEDFQFKQELEANPPQIIGGFHVEKEAERVLNSYKNEDVTDVGDELVVAKGVLKANDGTFYPVFIHISSQDAGELYGIDFIDSKSNQVIPLQFIFPYILKDKKSINPYKYRTLSRIPRDIHQSNWPDYS